MPNVFLIQFQTVIPINKMRLLCLLILPGTVLLLSIIKLSVPSANLDTTEMPLVNALQDQLQTVRNMTLLLMSMLNQNVRLVKKDMIFCRLLLQLTITYVFHQFLKWDAVVRLAVPLTTSTLTMDLMPMLRWNVPLVTHHLEESLL